jgi:DNA polymerase II small subunit/DNA polymerase delta subunit B
MPIDFKKLYLKTLDEKKALKKENEELKEKITCLESDSYNEISMAQYEDMKEDYEEEMEKLKQYKEYYDNWSLILSDIDGDEFCDLLSDYGWEYNDEGELVNICKD